jgi:hypothetical protein
MNRLLLGSVKFLGLAAAGVALAVGWKLGSYLVDVCLDEDTRDRFFEGVGNICGEEKEPPLWKRQFSRISDE